VRGSHYPLEFAFELLLYWFPTGGWGTWQHLVLPAITLGSVYAAYIARLTRGGMLEVIQSNYIRTARAKGLREKTIVTSRTAIQIYFNSIFYKNIFRTFLVC
jgi:ABC-type dipeptide/oligopeptide/nickel transport system permease component